MNDCLVSCFCPCCSANQLYQTTQLRGNPTPDGGSHHNRGEWKTQLGTGNARSCLYSCCCMPCAVGTMMETAVSLAGISISIPYLVIIHVDGHAMVYGVLLRRYMDGKKPFPLPTSHSGQRPHRGVCSSIRYHLSGQSSSECLSVLVVHCPRSFRCPQHAAA